MLYDPKWEKQVNQDKQLGPISLRAFIAWLETKPADEFYDYSLGRSCALGQYQASCGLKDWDCYVDLGFQNDMLPWQRELKLIVSNNCDDTTWTFGAALERARQCLAAG